MLISVLDRDPIETDMEGSCDMKRRTLELIPFNLNLPYCPSSLRPHQTIKGNNFYLCSTSRQRQFRFPRRQEYRQTATMPAKANTGAAVKTYESLFSLEKLIDWSVGVIVIRPLAGVSLHRKSAPERAMHDSQLDFS